MGLSDVRFLSALEILPWWRDSGGSLAMQGNICGTLIQPGPCLADVNNSLFPRVDDKEPFLERLYTLLGNIWKRWPGQKIYQVLPL